MKERGKYIMKKLVALLLTVALLLGMAGTAAVAAEDTFPTATVSVGADGAVSVKVSSGVKDYKNGYADVNLKDNKGSRRVNLKLNDEGTAFVGTDADVAGGTIASFRLYADSWYGTYAAFSYNKGAVSSAEIGTLKEEKTSTGTKITDKVDYRTYKTTGAVKTKKSEESVSNYDKDGYYLGGKTTTKSYNANDVLTGSGEGTTTATYNAAKDERTDTYVGKDKSYSDKGLQKSTKKSNQTTEWKKIDGEFTLQTVKGETKKTNRDDILSELNAYSSTYDKDGIMTEMSDTTKTYNTYTKALKNEEVITGKKNTDKIWEYTVTSSTNNDDGSLRYKTVNTYKDYYEGPGAKTITESHYNNAGKVVASKDKDGTWTDGNGTVIGKNVPMKDGNSQTTSVYFKRRNGEIDRYEVETNEKATDGTSTYTRIMVEDGKKVIDEKRIHKADGSYEEYYNGVLKESHTTKEGTEEKKYYDAKGGLYLTAKTKDGVTTCYDYRGKKVQEEKDGTTTYYDPNTEKVTGFDKSISDEEGWGTEHYDADSKLRWTEKYISKSNETVYTDANGKEFAKTFYDKYDSATEETTGQLFYDKDTFHNEGSSYWYYGGVEPENLDNATASLVNRVTKATTVDDTTTSTTTYTKWDVVNGEKKNEMTRKDETITTTDFDKTETKTYRDGTLIKSTEAVKNSYGDTVKTTTKVYDWFTGKQTGTTKKFQDGKVDGNTDDPMSYYKRYDKYSNLQEVTVVDNTDQWHWDHTYYADGGLKSESWYDGLDSSYYQSNYHGNTLYDSSYNATYYLNGNLAWRKTNTLGTENEVSYNKDGSYAYWGDTVDGVTNSWLYNKYGELTGYRWNETDGDGFYSFDYYDAAGSLVYSFTNVYGGNEYSNESFNKLTYTDPAGNKWERVGDDVTLTLKNNGTGWQKAVGEWFYIENGKPVRDAWKKIDGSWYYFTDDGFMDIGLVATYTTTDGKTTSKTYAVDGLTGELVTGGWAMLNDDGTAWAFTDKNGEVLTGWQRIDGQWYYFTDGWDNGQDSANFKDEAEWTQSGWRGIMATGATKVWNSDWKTKHTYFFNEDGTWDNSPGWKVAEDIEVGENENGTLYGVEYHYYDKKGNEVTGWQKIDGEWYYFNEDGVMKNGWVKSGANWYFMDPQYGGAMATDGWAEDVYEGWYYMDKNGNYKTGWLNDGGEWYYLKSDGAMASNEWAKYGNNWYYMGTSGEIKTGWVKDEGNWYYMKQDGAMKSSGWVGEGSTWYYVGADGAMVADTDVTVDGKTYHFDETGLCTNP